MARQLAGDSEGSLEALKTSLDLEPNSVDARVQYAGVLLESGDADEAIRQLLEALRFEPRNDEAHAMMARAYHDKGAWQSVVASADKALALNASNAMAQLWRADGLRMIAAGMPPGPPRNELYASARSGYDAFLGLTNFSSSIGERLAFHFIGSGFGSRKHADREESYRSLRNSGYLGLCLTEQRVGNPLRARGYCQRATKYQPDDPITFFLLGNINRDLFNDHQECEYLTSAAESYNRMLGINDAIAEARNAKNYLEQIAGIARKVPC
jgi:tetratricopeptide (TPR) repeat protein